MPRLVISNRGVISAGTRFDAPNRGSWIRVASDETVCRFALDRAIDHDLLTDEITGQFISWQDGDPFREVCQWSFEISYDNGNTWENLGRGATGPEVVRKPVADPDATKPVLLKTQMWMRMKAQAGNQARLIRYVVDVPETLETEIEVETYDDGGGFRTLNKSGSSVTYQDSAGNSAAGASSVSSGNVTNAGNRNRCSFAWGAVGGSTTLTVSSFNIEETSATLVTGSNIQQTGSGAESWCYVQTGVGTSAHDADFTASGTANDIFCVIQTHSDVDQTTPYDNVGTDSNNYFPSDFGVTTAINATSKTDERVIDCCVVSNWSSGHNWTGTPPTANVLLSLSSGETIVRSGHEDGAATVGIGYDYDTSVASAVYSYLNVRRAVQYMYPISATTNGGNNSYTEIDEVTPSDTDYWYGDNNQTDQLIGALTDLSGTTPGSGTCYILVRQAQADSDAGTPAPSSGGTNATFDISIDEGATNLASATGVSCNEGSFAAYTTLSFSAASVTSWSALTYTITSNGTGGSPALRRAAAISSLRIEVPGDNTAEGGGTSFPQGLQWTDRGIGVQRANTLGGDLH